MLNDKDCIFREIISSLAFFVIMVGASSPLRAQEEGSAHRQSSPLKILSPTVQRVVFDSSAFTTRGVPIPYFDRGYVISRKVETFAPNTPNVMLYGKDGQKAREAAIWFPESTRVAITSAALTPDGRIVASGEADKTDGTRAPFIALTDLSGKIATAIQTKDFYPTNVCVAPDNTVWSFGSTWWDDVNQRPLPGDLLRHFDFAKGQLDGYVPRSTFPGPAFRDNPTAMRCSSTAVVIFSGPENTYIVMPYEGKGPLLYSAPTPVGLMLTGLAILEPDSVCAMLIAHGRAGDPRQGLYLLELDEKAKAVHWSPVEGTVGPRTRPGTVVMLWGSDGEYLVLRHSHDPGAVHWAKLSDSAEPPQP